ncbi:MAG: hypothetical protein JXR60_05075 [Bacteroidales bacterium]|nr:hypothetical protein [Bacteroidales bacterium]
MKKLLLIISALTLLQVNLMSQEVDSLYSIGVDVNSRYVWRGTDFGASPSIQPCIEVSKYNLTLGVWGAYTTNMFAAQEADLYLSYNIKDMVSVTVTDYFFPNETQRMDGYFTNWFDKDLSGHSFEAMLSFTYKNLSVMGATMVYGADAVKSNGDRAYSTYLELGYTHKNIDYFIGASPGEGIYQARATGFNVVNLGLTGHKDLKITESFSLPISASLIVNPEAEKIFIVIGFSL